MTLEQHALAGWRAWGRFAKFTCCDGCGAFVYCRRGRRGRRFVCVACFDQGER